MSVSWSNTQYVVGLVSIVALALLAIATPLTANEAPPADVAKPVFASGHRTAPIPIRLASGKVHVPVRINDAEPVFFIVDTGANVTILDRTLAERLELPLRGETRAGGAAGGDGTYRLAFTEVTSLGVPGLTLPGQGVAVIDRDTAGANGLPSFGLLGADLLKQLVVEIDYAAATLTVHDPESYVYEGPGQAVPITLDANDKPRFDGSIVLPGGDTVRTIFGLDTGSRGFLTLYRHFVELHDLETRLPATPKAMVGLGVGGPVVHHQARLGSLQVGPFTVDAPPITFAAAGERGAFAGRGRDALLGARFLQRFRIVLDYPRGRIIFAPATPLDEPDPVDASGLFLIAEGEKLDRFRIAAVAPDSPAEAAGLAADDYVVALDRVPTVHVTLDELRAQLRRDGEDALLEIERNGETFRRTLRLRAPI